MKKLIWIVLPLLLSTTANADPITITSSNTPLIKKQLATLVEQHKLNTLGVSVIKDGEISLLEHFGLQSPDVPASTRTLFDVGSITKTVATQTVLALVQEGKIALDEPMHNYWIDPDIESDERYKKLTPRTVLTHTTGFPNWRFFTQDGKLKFFNTPGEKYGYSGEGFKYLAKFVENKLNTPFEDLAAQHVFTPTGINNISLRVNKALFPQIAQSLDAKGKFHGYYCRPEGWCSKEGSVSVAGSMVVSVEDYSKFLIWVMNGNALNPMLNQQLASIDMQQDIIKGFDCKKLPNAHCPTNQGYGLGWNVTTFGDRKVIGHGGADWSVTSLAYFYPDSKDGVVIFINAPGSRGAKAIIDILKLLDPNSPKLHEYQFRLDRN